MTIQDCADIVEKLLRQRGIKYADHHAQLIYERGYLTGLIARIMLTDPILRREFEERIKHKK